MLPRSSSFEAWADDVVTAAEEPLGYGWKTAIRLERGSQCYQENRLLVGI